MSEKAHWPDNKGLRKEMNNKTFYLGRSWDLTNGKGWFCQVHCNRTFNMGFGFHKTNKFTAVRIALKVLRNGGY